MAVLVAIAAVYWHGLPRGVEACIGVRQVEVMDQGFKVVFDTGGIQNNLSPTLEPSSVWFSEKGGLENTAKLAHINSHLILKFGGRDIARQFGKKNCSDFGIGGKWASGKDSMCANRDTLITGSFTKIIRAKKHLNKD